MPETIITEYETGKMPAVRNIVFITELQNPVVAGSTTRNTFTEKFKVSESYSPTPKTINFKEWLFGLPFLPPNEILRAFNNYRIDVEPTFKHQPALETPFCVCG